MGTMLPRNATAIAERAHHNLPAAVVGTLTRRLSAVWSGKDLQCLFHLEARPYQLSCSHFDLRHRMQADEPFIRPPDRICFQIDLDKACRARKHPVNMQLSQVSFDDWLHRLWHFCWRLDVGDSSCRTELEYR
eukprot:6346153-Prymnesium_polylepis.1